MASDRMSPGSRIGFDALPDQVIQQIAQLETDFERRRSVLPLINKRWARVLGGPSEAWDSVDFSVRASADELPSDPTAAFTWFLRRPGCVHNLRIDRNTANGQRLPHASVTAAITMTQASSLRYIRINTDDRSFTGCDAAFLMACTGLRSLRSDSDGGFEKHGAVMLQIVSGLPALTKLVLLGNLTGNAELLPSCTEMAAFRSPSLRELCVGMTPERLPVTQELRTEWHIMQADNALRLRLSELRRLELHWNISTMLLDDDTFAETAKLRVLLVGQQLSQYPRTATLTLSPRCLAPLQALKTLLLDDCALDGVPPVVALVGASLTMLSLVNNRNLQLSDHDLTVLLDLQCLKKLDVRKSTSNKTANLWNESSIQVLLDLPGKLMAKHGVTPVVVFESSAVPISLLVI